MPKRVKGIPTTIKRKIKFLVVDGDQLRGMDKQSRELVKTNFSTVEGMDLLKMFNGKAFLKIPKTSITIKSK